MFGPSGIGGSWAVTRRGKPCSATHASTQSRRQRIRRWPRGIGSGKSWSFSKRARWRRNGDTRIRDATFDAIETAQTPEQVQAALDGALAQAQGMAQEMGLVF
jgi:hypothetical protein